MWPPRWLGETFSRLYREKGIKALTLDDVFKILGSKNYAKVALSRMRRAGLAYLHGFEGRRRLYRLCDPETLILIAAGAIRNLEKVSQGRYARLLGCFTSELLRRMEGIKSVVLYGSVARGRARKDSDVDILVVIKSAPPLSRVIDQLIDMERSEKVEEELDWLYDKGTDTHISLHPMLPQTLGSFPPILLDVVEDGVPIFDDGFYSEQMGQLKARLRKVGAKRVFLSEDDWYWDLGPDLRFGQVVSI